MAQALHRPQQASEGEIVVQVVSPRAPGPLVVDRPEPPCGVLFWRRAPYVVYERLPDGTRVEVLRGVYSSGRAALAAARRGR